MKTDDFYSKDEKSIYIKKYLCNEDRWLLFKRWKKLIVNKF